MVINIEDIERIGRRPDGLGYEIAFRDGRSIRMDKRRTIIALLILIKYGDGCERDLTGTSVRMPEVKAILQGKYDPGLFQDSYGDANKPFSELWNEEGFSWIEHPPGATRDGSQQYILHPADHDALFLPVRKAMRRSPTRASRELIDAQQTNRCNICGSIIRAKAQIRPTDFCKDRLRAVYDHRVPVEKGGTSDPQNYQFLCFFCNKSKWQVCNICQLSSCVKCALAFPETSTQVACTEEDISDRMRTPSRS